MTLTCFFSMVSECSVPLGAWLSARSQSVVRMAIILFKMKIYSRFKGTDLSRSMLANFVGTGAPWRPWDDGSRHGQGVFFYLASA